MLTSRCLSRQLWSRPFLVFVFIAAGLKKKNKIRLVHVGKKGEVTERRLSIVAVIRRREKNVSFIWIYVSEFNYCGFFSSAQDTRSFYRSWLKMIRSFGNNDSIQFWYLFGNLKFFFLYTNTKTVTYSILQLKIY